jgi:hypothetical protein
MAGGDHQLVHFPNTLASTGENGAVLPHWQRNNLLVFGMRSSWWIYVLCVPLLRNMCLADRFSREASDSRMTFRNPCEIRKVLASE